MMMGKQAGGQPPRNGSETAAIAELSDRQYACLVHAGEGMSSKEIGRLLGISPSTVDNHIHVAVAKLHAKNRWHAAQLLHPERHQNGPKQLADDDPITPLIPPLGGMPNASAPRSRLTQIVAIAVISIIVVTSAVVLVLGAIEVFTAD